VLQLPAAARAACWLNAWLAGREGADAVISGLAEPGRATEFVGPEPGSRLAPALFLGELRRWGVRRVSSALPAPGDPLGLGGPPGFNADSIEAGEAVVLHGAELGLVPGSAGSVTSWQVTRAAAPPYLPQVGDAGRELRAALAAAADSLARLDVVSWRPEIADDLQVLRRPGRPAERLPFAAPECARVASEALRAAAIVTLARSDDTGPVSARDADERSAALQPLDRAARAALVAATSSYDGS
jgi:hypothetical protein